ncbi:MAG: hypothetical protein ACO1RT_03160, partial [Planctomycetaceae bacterium]
SPANIAISRNPETTKAFEIKTKSFQATGKSTERHRHLGASTSYIVGVTQEFCHNHRHIVDSTDAGRAASSEPDPT